MSASEHLWKAQPIEPDDVRELVDESGSPFFSGGAMRGFDSHLEDCGAWKVYGGVLLFVTSEQFHDSNGRSLPRRYTVRQARPREWDGCYTVRAVAGGYQAHATQEDAREAMDARALELQNELEETGRLES